MTKRTHDGDMLEVFRQEFENAAASFGLGKHITQDIAEHVEDRVRLRVGGDYGYVARKNIARRNARIREQAKTLSIEAIAREHNLSPRRIEQILAEGEG